MGQLLKFLAQVLDLVRMVSGNEFLVCGLDLCLGRTLVNAQDLIRVLILERILLGLSACTRGCLSLCLPRPWTALSLIIPFLPSSPPPCQRQHTQVIEPTRAGYKIW